MIGVIPFRGGTEEREPARVDEGEEGVLSLELEDVGEETVA